MATEELVQQVERLKEAEAGVKAGSEKIRLGDFDGALAELKTVLDKNPEDPNALYLSGHGLSPEEHAGRKPRPPS